MAKDKTKDKDGTVAIGEPVPMHLKQPGGTLACGESPHDVIATFMRAKVTCKPCKKAMKKDANA